VRGRNPEGAPSTKVPKWLRVLIPFALIGIWLGVGGAGGIAFGQISSVATNDQAEFLPASAEATKVQKLQEGFRGETLIPGIVVYERVGGLSAADQKLIDRQRDAIAGIEGVSSADVSPALVSDDGAAAEIFVPLDTTVKIAGTVERLRTYLGENATEGLGVWVTGPAGLTADLAEAFTGIDGILLLVAFVAVLIILVIVYRSPLLPIIVLGTSLFALTASVFTVVALARADILTLTGQTQGILFILVIGAATDYSLLYVARFREALRENHSRWQATLAALKTAWEPIVASGATVIAGLLILLLSDLNSNKSLGPVAAIGVGFAILAALTLLPALMMAAGRVAFWPRRPEAGSPNPESTDRAARGLWPRLGAGIARRPRLIWVASTLGLVAAAGGLLQLKADGVPQSEFVLGPSQARDGQAVLGTHFPGGSGTPAVVIAPESELTEVAGLLLDTNGVASVAVLSEDSPSGTLPITEDGIQPLGPPGTPVGDPTIVDGSVMLEATLDDAGDSPEAEATVRELRSQLADRHPDALVGGVTAVAIDTNATALHDRSLIIPIVLVVITLILMILLRSVLAPVILILSVVVSFAAALGVAALVFNGILRFPGADPSVPLFGFVFLVALGVDYNIFLMTRVREESRIHGTREGILRGLASTGGVITSAGIVLAATFAALSVIPILFLAQIAFIVAFGVLVDTFLVRSLLVPAISYDIGRAIWWPSRLSRGAP